MRYRRRFRGSLWRRRPPSLNLMNARRDSFARSLLHSKAVMRFPVIDDPKMLLDSKGQFDFNPVAVGAREPNLLCALAMAIARAQHAACMMHDLRHNLQSPRPVGVCPLSPAHLATRFCRFSSLLSDIFTAINFPDRVHNLAFIIVAADCRTDCSVSGRDSWSALRQSPPFDVFGRCAKAEGDQNERRKG